MKIESNIPIPPRQKIGELDGVMARMKLGDSIVWPGSSFQPYRVARRLKFGITTRKESGIGRRVWRIK